MELVRKIYLSTLILVVLTAEPLESVEIKPVRCPTNKIAPHRRIPSWSNRVQERTFGGAFIDLLSPDGLRPQELPNDLQEQPQEEDPDDCGEIEDYDESDFSSVTQKPNRQGRQDQRFFFGLFQTYPPLTTRTRPPSTSAITTLRPTNPTRPPFWSGGLFGNNPYRPPRPENPSDSVKPVHEHNASEDQTTYWPNIVGGPLGNIIGASPAIPPIRPMTTPEPYDPETRQPQARYTRRPRPNLPNYYNRYFGSFVDLFI